MRTKWARLCPMRNEVKNFLNFLKFKSSKSGAFELAMPFKKLLSATMLFAGVFCV